MKTPIKKMLLGYNSVKNKEMILKYIKNNDAIYDFGCGDLKLFDIIKKETDKKNLKLIGYDIDPLLKKMAKNKHYLFKKPEELKDGSIDIITMLEVIEHLSYKEFDKIFSKLNKKLKKGGLFILSTPNIKCLRIIDEFWQHLEHIRPYPIAGLKCFFEKRGYKLIKDFKLGIMLNPIKILRSIILGYDIQTNIVMVLRKGI